jgi:hypothetical protein
MLASYEGSLVNAWFEKFKDGTGAQYLVVTVSYNDVFGKRHRTGYRGILSAKSLREGKPIFQLCEEGNYST